ncbi:MAG: metallophosphoesterase [Armatimonadota bacterium]|nr:metallophosphoesterase [Armatimonadota bacterium]
MITAIVTSDNHLGAYYARFRPDRLEGRRRRLQENFERVVDAAIDRKADLFLHAGDLFDRPDPRNAERNFVAGQVRRLLDARIPLFVIAGNHDRPRSFGYDGGALPHEELEALGAIHLFRETQKLVPEIIFIRRQRVCIWGMSSDFNRPPGACPLEGIAEHHQRGGDIDLVLLHYGVEGWAQPFANEPCLSLANLDRLQADAICVGHLHTPNERRLPGGAVLLNPGATEHIHFGEEHLRCGFWQLQLETGHAETEYIPLRTQPMRTLDLSVDSPATGEGSSERPPGPQWRYKARLRHWESKATDTNADIAPQPPNRGATDIGPADSTPAVQEPSSLTLADTPPMVLPQSWGPGGGLDEPEALMQSFLQQIANATRIDGLLRIRLMGQIPKEAFRKLDPNRLLKAGGEGSFHCQLDLDHLTIYDELADLPFGVGVSFDAGRELQFTVDELIAHYADDPVDGELYRLTGLEIAAAYERYMGGRR